MANSSIECPYHKEFHKQDAVQVIRELPFQPEKHPEYQSFGIELGLYLCKEEGGGYFLLGAIGSFQSGFVVAYSPIPPGLAMVIKIPSPAGAGDTDWQEQQLRELERRLRDAWKVYDRQLWLTEHWQEIEQKYPGKYIAVVAREIVAVGNSMKQAYQIASQNYPIQSILVEYVPASREEVQIAG